MTLGKSCGLDVAVKQRYKVAGIPYEFLRHFPGNTRTERDLCDTAAAFLVWLIPTVVANESKERGREAPC